MKKTIFFALILGTMFFSAKASGRPAPYTVPVVTNYFISVNEDFFVNNTDGGEWVHFTGQMHILSKFFPTDPVIPTDPLRLHINAQGIQGIGASSGLIYQVNGSFSTSFTTTADSENELEFSLHLLPPNPIRLFNEAATYSLNFSLSQGFLTNAQAVMIATEGF